MRNKVLNDQTVKIIAEVPENREDLIIPTLQSIQEVEGFIPEMAVNSLAERIGTKPAHIYGVATFYNQFRLTPLGKHVIRVCRGTACHVKGSGKILNSLCQNLGIKPGETTKDGLFTIEEVACLGACSIAPAIMVDDKFYGHVTMDGVLQLTNALKRGFDKANDKGAE